MASMSDPSASRKQAAVDRRRELGAFLRSRRARLRPGDVGLVDWGVRRVPGLRREEVAQLANVGLTWYTWLEQGRNVHPSVSVLSAIADALRLDPFEREHLLSLTREPEGTRGRGQASAAPERGRLVAGFEPAPAYAISSRFDVLAHNRAAGLLFGDLGPEPSGSANMMRRAFINPAWRELIVDWEQEAARHVAMYRAAMTLHLDDPDWTELPEELAQQSADFARHWSRSDVAGPERRLKRFRHPIVGQLTLHSTSLLMADDVMIRLVILHPSGPPDAEKLNWLVASPSSAP
jgi:transcriptional regulator with XRE-family HTH domain